MNSPQIRTTKRISARAAACLIAATLALIAFSPRATGHASSQLTTESDERRTESVDPGFRDEYPSVLITNPRVVAELETKGVSFGDVLGARDPESRRQRDYA